MTKKGCKQDKERKKTSLGKKETNKQHIHDK